MIPFQLHRRIPLVRRPFYQRDRAIEERDRLAADRDRIVEERDRLAADRDHIVAERDRLTESLEDVRGERDRLKGELVSAWLRHRPNALLTGWQPATVASVPLVDDRELIKRIVAAYRAACQTPLGSTDSLWFTSHADPKRDIHDALNRDDPDQITRILRDPGSSALFYGFDALVRPGMYRTDPVGFWDYEAPYDALRCLAEALAVHRLENPEHRYYAGERQADANPSADAILQGLDRCLGFAFDFPNLFIGETGLATSRGVITYRVVQALYQTRRILDFTNGAATPRIAEIGGGLGRTAYYSWGAGRRDYTLVDIPMTAVAQAYFLGRTLGPDAVCLFGEDRPGIRLLPPAAFLDGGDKYELVVNVDSLTEMAVDTARAYCGAIHARADLFLSINHEINSFTVREVSAEAGLGVISRTPYWLRRGYVEEVFAGAETRGQA